MSGIPRTRWFARAIDAVLEASVVGSFTSIGHAVRQRVVPWEDAGRLDGRRVVLTGATSGIGQAALGEFVRRGAEVWFLARDPGRAEEAASEALGGADASHDPVGTAHHIVADLADLGTVDAFAATLAERVPAVDVIVHNAGALSSEHTVTPQGFETTLATQVLAPFRLTHRLLPLLAPGARVVTMSSGGMYTQRLRLEGLEMDPDRYRGSVAYARAKRAQVVLNRGWAERHPELCFFATHPGWVDTPGIASSLPGFHRILGPVLRSPAEGADTIVWLASADHVGPSGTFWHDRRIRSEHRLPGTRAADAVEAELWDWVRERALVQM